MIPEIGHFALILALSVAIVQAVMPLVGAARGMPNWIAVAVPAARAQFVLNLIAFACLTYAFVTHDFSVAYVANHSNLDQPLIYRISAVWGAHEGSLLLWTLMLAGWGFAVTVFSRGLPDAFAARVLAVLALVSVGFLLFTLLTSNPFDRILPAPLDGRELNPLLQDPGLAIHPPMLYMGYVGLAVPFAFAIAALLDGRLDSAWVRWSRPWTVMAWVFLTLGIALGSWWAYYELGWGGWWFWDPVENASFMPWLVATALLHSLAVTEKRGAFRAWTVLLAITAFSLSLLGTFLVRSGVLVSVHAFATDPARGVYILAFLAIVIGSSLVLYAWRARTVSRGGSFELLSRETFLLVNNVLLMVAAASVLLGTLYPLFLDAMGVGKISVGPPYFDTVFVPLMLPLAFAMAIGHMVRWRQDSMGRVLRKLLSPALITILLGIIAVLTLPSLVLLVAVAVWLSLWILGSALVSIATRVRSRGTLAEGLKALTPGFLGMHIAHLGLAVTMTGIAVTSAFSLERDVTMRPGDSVELGGYTYRFDGVRAVPADPSVGRNYSAQRGDIRIFKDEREVTLLHPEKRSYSSQQSPMTEAAIQATLIRDLYVALGEPADDGAWSVRVYYKPFVQWLWLGAVLMGLGGLLAITDRRYRLARKAAAVAPDARVADPGVPATGRAT